MAQVKELKAEARIGTGKARAYQARQKGLIPGVIYGGEAAPENVAVDYRTLERHVEGGHFLTTLFLLDLGRRQDPRDPAPGAARPGQRPVVHVDFLRLAEGATVRLEIPVLFRGQGESPGLKKGGVLNIVRHEIELICPAESIPNEIVVDIAKLDINETVHISALSLPEGVRPVIQGRDFTVCSIVAPTSVKEEQRAAAAAASSPAAEAAPAEAAAAAPAAGAKAPAAGAKAPAAPAKK